MVEEKLIGKVFSYFNKISVAAIEITDDNLIVGDKIHIKGSTTDFEQEVESMQVDGKEVEEVSRGKSAGVKVIDVARSGDEVYKIE